MKNFVFYEYVNQVTKNTFTPLFQGSGSMSNPPIRSYGYRNWVDRFYEADVYDIWVSAISEFVEKAATKPCFVFTPTTVSTRDKLIWNQVDTSFSKLGVEYVNTYPALENIFTLGFRPRSDWANLADGHPGDKQTDLYSEAALSCLNEGDILIQD